MATKLENLKITKVDFVDNGANPEANVMIFKSEDPAKTPTDSQDKENLEDKEMKDAGDDEFIPAKKGSIKKVFEYLAKAFGMEKDDESMDKEPNDVEKSATLFKDNVSLDKVIDAIRMNGYGMSESMISIMEDNEIANKQDVMLSNLQDYFNLTSSAIEYWAKGQVQDDIAKSVEEINPDYHNVFKSAKLWLDEQIEKANNQKNETEEESMDLTKMSKEDRAAYDALVAKYNTKDDSTVGKNCGATDDEDVTAEAAKKKKEDADAKALEDKKKVKKSAEEATEDIYKSLPDVVVKELTYLRKRADASDDKELMEVAKGYEMIGKKADELFPVLKSLKTADETAYNNMIEILDASKAAVEKSGLFDEIGKSGHNIQGMTAIEKKANEVMEKNPEISRFEAIDKVFDSNPELKEEYDKTINKEV